MRASNNLRSRARKIFDWVEDEIWRGRVRVAMLGSRGEDEYLSRLAIMHRKLGISEEYAARGLCLFREAREIVCVPAGPNGELRPLAPVAWSRASEMRKAAEADGVMLTVRWGFRSVADQARMIRKQLSYGKSLDEALNRIAAPGYSEHHTGRAIDFERIPANIPFDRTPAFAWLYRNAAKFEFRMSYPPDNPYGIIYEPWHWYCYSGEMPEMDFDVASDPAPAAV
ncbi:M15 family metallopeptidase [Aromatoleum sp.]|uniref:M15 family metallopeptidase n=1 Tax=Aromatoleum sp. TaxID=2307007 RepID=UPI002FCC3149